MAADLDLDGDIDLAIEDGQDARSFILLNRGDGSFDRGADLDRDPAVGGLVVFDADGDGDQNLVGTTAGSKLAFLPGDGRGGFEPALVSGETPLLGFDLQAADFDGNGLSDLAVLRGADCFLSTFLNRTSEAASRDQDRNDVPDECAAPSGGQLPSDANQDGKLDITDVVWLLGRLYLGSASPWPCDGGQGVRPGPADLRLLDATDDGALNIADPIALRSHLFLGGAPPALGTRCLAMAGCPERCAP